MTTREQEKYDLAVKTIEICRKAFYQMGAGEMVATLSDTLLALKKEPGDAQLIITKTDD